MTRRLLILGVIAANLIGVFALAGCGSAGPDNADMVKKAAANTPPSNNPDVPPVDAKNDEGARGPKKGG